MGQVILTGVLQKFPSMTHNSHYYDNDLFLSEIAKYNRQLVYDRRKKIVDKLLKNNGNDNE